LEIRQNGGLCAYSTSTDDANSRKSKHAKIPLRRKIWVDLGGEKGMVYFFASQPISENKCRGFCIIGRNYDMDEPDTILQNFEQVIFDQDKRIVESQRPEQVPFDFAEELHLKFDTVAMNYRKAMKAEGLTD
jgi:phenylpropionate dioxygenase-like ring-hydroxylating dioxygenase large terminal subunit